MAILMVYIPVAIDATVLHVAAPTLSVELGTSGNELLWIIDIYSLVMAGMVLPMGALGDKIGFKRLLLLGSGIFGLASLAAAFSPTALTLIASRALLAIGAAMIVPATLAGIRTTFAQARHRNMALGLWAAVGSGGAAFGPLVGGMLLEHFYWGSVFLINVPIVLVVIAINARVVPRQPARREQPLNLFQALVLIAAISSAIALIEVDITYFLDRAEQKGRKGNRPKVAFLVCLAIFAVSVLVGIDGLGTTGVFPWPATAGWNDSMLDFVDMLSEGLAMPIGALMMSIMVGWEIRPQTVLDVLHIGYTGRIDTFYRICIKYITPIGMLLVLAGQVNDFFSLNWF